jgi:hypothetical protein
VVETQDLNNSVWAHVPSPSLSKAAIAHLHSFPRKKGC